MDDLKEPEKTSRWTDAEREAAAAPPPQATPPADARPPLPPWVQTFAPGSTFEYDGWTCAVRHVGYEGGCWMMLVEPVDFKPPRGAERAEFRRLREQVGKKKVKEVIHARTNNS